MEKYVFVSDFYSDQITGGAELTSDALLENRQDVIKLQSQNITVEVLQKYVDKHWIFGNFSMMDYNLIPTIIKNINYSIIEFDYKFCIYRSTHKHKAITGNTCDCVDSSIGKLISTFYHGADVLFWMSKKQRNEYFARFPFLRKNDNFILSSVFNKSFLKKIKKITCKSDGKFIILNSNSWIKNKDFNIDYAKRNNLNYKLISNLSYKDMISEIAKSKGLIFQPSGYDTCPRLVIEAKLLDCELILNENVQHKDEIWFKDKKSILSYLENRQDTFWNKLETKMNESKTISGYTTTLNCIDQKYPFLQSIRSMLGFCDQVVIVDGGSTDGTWEELKKLKDEDSRIRILRKDRNWNDKRFAVYDGVQKALARSLCTSDWCWQQDSDEVVHEDDYKKVQSIIKMTPKSYDLVALPVIEYWGSKEKVRMDINPWKWRLSRNKKYITHGIPINLRMIDNEGMLYALPGTDGCDYIDTKTFELIPFVNFYNSQIHQVKQAALNNNEEARQVYEEWFNSVTDHFPGVYHYSWYNLERKIRTYKGYWSKHWTSLYDMEQDDTPENNMFFDKKWADVSDEEIKELASELKEKLGGWIFHSKVDLDAKIPHVYVVKPEPNIMKEFKWEK